MNLILKLKLHFCLMLFISLSSDEFVNSHSFPIKNIIKPNNPTEVPTVYSYHIHCQFINGDSNKTKVALDFRQRFIEQFKLQNVIPCRDLFDDIRLCMFGTIASFFLFLMNIWLMKFFKKRCWSYSNIDITFY